MPHHVGSISTQGPVLSPDARGGDAYALFHERADLFGIPVCDGDQPIGYVSRVAFLLRMADRFGRALFESRPISLVMDQEPLIIDAETHITDLGHRIVSEKPEALEQGFVIVRDGRYLGIGSGIALLGAMLKQKEAFAESLQHLADQREIAEREARLATEAKTAFLAAMSHEIRTPLNGILGLAHALALTNLNQDQMRLVKTIESSGGLLNRVLSDVLDLSRIEAAATTLELEAECPAAILRDARELWSPQAAEKGLEFVARYEGITGRAALIDGDRLRQIVFNLINNAIKFTQTGRITVLIEMSVINGQHLLEISVEDTGIGIAPEALSTLFKPFVQADATITRRFGGTGLGLTISSKLIELMGGTVSVTSVLGNGSKFAVQLPVDTVAVETVEIVTTADVEEQDDIAWHVLVVEDNAVNRTVLSRLLQAVGCTIVTASDGSEALELLSSQTFDIVLMDVQMPVMDGLTATRLLRKRPGPESKLPVIALTANVFAEDKQKCIDAGMDGFVGKPINPTALLTAINDAFAVRSASNNEGISAVA